MAVSQRKASMVQHQIGITTTMVLRNIGQWKVGYGFC